MIKLDLDKIEFHAVVVTSKDEIKQSKINALSYRQDYQARDLGLLIAEKKGWKSEPTGDTVTSRLDLYVFSREELREYMNQAFKARLINMADTEDYLTEHQRQALLMQAERF